MSGPTLSEPLLDSPSERTQKTSSRKVQIILIVLSVVFGVGLILLVIWLTTDIFDDKETDENLTESTSPVATFSPSPSESMSTETTAPGETRSDLAQQRIAQRGSNPFWDPEPQTAVAGFPDLYGTDTSLIGHYTQTTEFAIAQNVQDAICFVGDSITWGLQNFQFFPQGVAEWMAWVNQGYPVVNLGMAGDEPRHMAWRIEQLAPRLRILQTKVFVIWAGTNSIGKSEDPNLIAEAIQDLVDRITVQFPTARLWVVGVLPLFRTEANASFYQFFNSRIQAVNSITSQTYATANPAGESNPCAGFTRYVPMYENYVDSTGEPLNDLSDDGLHPYAPGGYQPFAQAITPLLAQTQTQPC